MTVSEFKSLSVGDKLEAPGHNETAVVLAYFQLAFDEVLNKFRNVFHVACLTAEGSQFILREFEAECVEKN